MSAQTPEGPSTVDGIEPLVALVEESGAQAIATAVAALHPADLAELLNALPRADSRRQVFTLLEPAIAATVITRVSPTTRIEILDTMSADDLRRLVEELDSDDAADLLGSVPKEQAQAVLQGLPGSLSARIQQLLKYPPDTAGGLMKSEYAAVFEGATVEEAVEIVRTLAEAVADIHNVLVVDQRFHLLGVLPLARLILARAGETVDAVMDRPVISVTVDTDQEEVARLFRKYDLVSLPVTDPRGALLGRITVDDVVDVLEEEANEDFSKLSGLGEEEPLFDSPMRAIRRRLPWLGLNLLTTSLSASVIGLFQGTIQSMALAAALMTIVAAQGGNAGVQTLTVMVRGMALGKISLAQARSILLKELAVGCGNGVALGIAAGVVTYRAAPPGAAGHGARDRAGGELPGGGARRQPDSAGAALAAGRSRRGVQRVRHRLHGHVRLPRVPRPAVAGLASVCVRSRSGRDSGLGTRNVRIIQNALPSPEPRAPSPDSGLQRLQRVVARAIDVEDLVHANELEQRPDRLGHRAELQVASLGVQLPEAGQDRAKARAVNEAQLAKIEHHLAARLEHGPDVALELLGVAGVQLFAGQHDHGDVADLFGEQFHEVLLRYLLQP